MSKAALLCVPQKDIPCFYTFARRVRVQLFRGDSLPRSKIPTRQPPCGEGYPTERIAGVEKNPSSWDNYVGCQGLGFALVSDFLISTRAKCYYSQLKSTTEQPILATRLPMYNLQLNWIIYVPCYRIIWVGWILQRWPRNTNFPHSYRL